MLISIEETSRQRDLNKSGLDIGSSSYYDYQEMYHIGEQISKARNSSHEFQTTSLINIELPDVITTVVQLYRYTIIYE
ncbi:hypothetical protein KSF78_0007749 [Schistosoma japonicum]|nr:hypothetical protein KSF78_0007749 [Schistosoma japonicum]